MRSMLPYRIHIIMYWIQWHLTLRIRLKSFNTVPLNKQIESKKNELNSQIRAAVKREKMDEMRLGKRMEKARARSHIYDQTYTARRGDDLEVKTIEKNIYERSIWNLFSKRLCSTLKFHWTYYISCFSHNSNDWCVRAGVDG